LAGKLNENWANLRSLFTSGLCQFVAALYTLEAFVLTFIGGAKGNELPFRQAYAENGV
jgi:hypothetical protein